MLLSHERRVQLSKIKGIICDHQGSPADLLKMGKEMRTTLGMHIALNSGIDHLLPRQVQSLILVRILVLSYYSFVTRGNAFITDSFCTGREDLRT
jgi:hypothetical protein